jgi:hypothetical protein
MDPTTKAAMLPQDRAFLISILGEDKVKELETSAAARGKALEDAGIKFKAGEATPDVSVESALMLSASLKIFEGVSEALHNSSEVVKTAASSIVITDTRLGELETKVDRTNLLLMSLLAPQQSSKSLFTLLTDEEKKQLEKLQATDDGQKPAPPRKKSMLEQLAEVAGAAAEE